MFEEPSGIFSKPCDKHAGDMVFWCGGCGGYLPDWMWGKNGNVCDLCIRQRNYRNAKKRMKGRHAKTSHKES